MSVLLHGSYFGLNFGDTLLCRLFAQWMRAAKSGEVVLPLASERNRRIIGADSRGVSKVSGARGLVLCGGGYFSEPRASDLRWTTRAYFRHILLIEWARRKMPYAILGVGAGPISSRKLQRDVAAIFEGAEIVVVRDPQSADSLYRWGVRRDISVGVDAVVTARPEELSSAGSDLGAIDAAREKHGAVAAVHLSAHPSRDDLAVARASIDWLSRATDMAIVLVNDSVPRVAGSEWSHQLDIPGPHAGRIIRHTYSGEPNELIAVLDSVDIAITTKLHVGIVRCSRHKPVISIPSHGKTPRFYQQMGLRDWCFHATESGWQSKLEALLVDWRSGRRPDWRQFEATRALGSYRNHVERFIRQLSLEK